MSARFDLTQPSATAEIRRYCDQEWTTELRRTRTECRRFSHLYIQLSGFKPASPELRLRKFFYTIFSEPFTNREYLPWFDFLWGFLHIIASYLYGEVDFDMEFPFSLSVNNLEDRYSDSKITGNSFEADFRIFRDGSLRSCLIIHEWDSIECFGLDFDVDGTFNGQLPAIDPPKEHVGRCGTAKSVELTPFSKKPLEAQVIQILYDLITCFPSELFPLITDYLHPRDQEKGVLLIEDQGVSLVQEFINRSREVTREELRQVVEKYEAKRRRLQ
jgi:hypothetical protein